MAGRRARGAPGFTLVEVLVALSILALAAGGITVALRMTARSMERGEEAVRDSVVRRARFSVLERVIRDANPAAVPTDNGIAGFFRGGRGRVAFLSVSPEASRRGRDFRVVSFREGSDPSGGRGLLLEERSPFAPGSASGGERYGPPRLVFPGASGVSFFYVSGFGESGAMETEESWDAGERKRLPVAVGIEFDEEGGGARRRIVVPLPVGVNQLPDKRSPFDAGPVG